MALKLPGSVKALIDAPPPVERHVLDRQRLEAEALDQGSDLGIDGAEATR
jgi:hypothetical protein